MGPYLVPQTSGPPLLGLSEATDEVVGGQFRLNGCDGKGDLIPLLLYSGVMGMSGT